LHGPLVQGPSYRRSPPCALSIITIAREDVKFGVPFARVVKLKPGETVLFSWIVYRSRAHRDRVNAKAMKDPRLANMADPKSMPFDIKRMAYGGFKILVDA
jgi:uncharacterized protein YbaA (DUF1428 family)